MFLNPVTEILGVMIAELQNTLRKEPVSSRTKEHLVPSEVYYLHSTCFLTLFRKYSAQGISFHLVVT